MSPASHNPQTSALRVLFALPGLHRVNRGAEVAFESVATELAKRPSCEVTLVGSGQAHPQDPYHFLHAPCRPRERFERWPRFPVFRDHYVYEEMTFAPGLWSAFAPDRYDATLTCSYPFVNWTLRAKRRGGRPRHIFVTQNGDWAAYAGNREYRFFSCDGLICTNPLFYARNRNRWRCQLIPNGVTTERFRGVAADRARFGLRMDAPVAIIVSALIPSKRVAEGVRAAAMVPDLQLLVLGDGERRDEIDALGRDLMAGRYWRTTVPYGEIPAAYASADVLLHMSKDESFGNVYIEALASGLPVVAHDWESTQWILGDHGHLVDTDRPEEVAAALRAAIERRADPELRRSYARDKFGWPVVADQYARFIESVVRGAA